MIKIWQDLIEVTDTCSPAGSVVGSVAHLYFLINMHLDQVLMWLYERMDGASTFQKDTNW